MGPEPLTYGLEDGVALITLNRPEHMNAVTTAMAAGMISLLRQADQDDAVRAVVVAGAGAAFCAGADLSGGAREFGPTDAQGRPTAPENHRDLGGQVALASHACRKPVLAAIHGAAVGVGITMTLGMDMRLAAEDAKIGFVFTRRGLVPEGCSTWFLPRLVGPGKAAELIFTGRLFRAREEAASGLFNHVLPGEQVLPRALHLAREVADNTSAVSTALAKAMLCRGMAAGHPHSAHLNESRAFLWAAGQADAREGVAAFMEKRAPRFGLSPTVDVPEFYRRWREEQDGLARREALGDGPEGKV